MRILDLRLRHLLIRCLCALVPRQLGRPWPAARSAPRLTRGGVPAGVMSAWPQPPHSPLGAGSMNMTSKPGTELREVVPAEWYFRKVCPSAGALLPPPGPCLRSGGPEKALRASRA
jgi:hypothetical protein